MAAARIIVLEQSSYWTVALRWSLADHGVPVVRLQRWSECLRMLSHSPASILLVDLSIREHCEDHLVHLADQYPLARWIALGSRRDAAALYLARELGAIEALTSRRNLLPTVRLIRRHIEMVGHDAAADIRGRIWHELPFGDSCLGLPIDLNS